jgi:bifunctional non-homologous end joining protein LigD
MTAVLLEPQLLERASTPPQGDAWLYEIKYDGYRLLASSERGRKSLYSRSGADWTSRLPWIAKAIGALDRDVHMDGELVYLTDDGLPDFERLRDATLSGEQGRLYYQVFDLLRLDGRDLTARPLIERKERLSALFRDAAPNSRLRYVSHYQGDAVEFLRSVDRLGLEGMVSKRVRSVYRGGTRSCDWIKTKCSHTQRFAVVGYTTELIGGKEVLATLALAGEGDRYAGRVEFGVPRRDGSLLEILQSLGARSASVADAPETSSIQWIEPLLAANVRCLRWEPGRSVRHAVLHGVGQRCASDIVIRR